VGDEAYYADMSRWAGQRLTQLDGVSTGSLSPQNRVDAQILASHLTYLRFTIGDLAEYQWNPMVANPGRAIYLLLARDFAPLPERLRSAGQRLAGLPEALAAARRVLASMPEVHIRTALGQFAGTEHFITTELARLARAAEGAGREVSEHIPGAVAAIGEHRRWLTQRLEDGDFRDPRLGAELYDRKLQLALDTEQSAETMLARARRDLAQAAEEIAEAAGATGREPARGQQVRRALDKLAADATDGTTILEFGRAAFTALCQFVTAHDLVTVYGDPVEVIEMPKLDRGISIARCDPPGPLETAPFPTFIAVSPPPDDWPPRAVTSFYRENNPTLLHVMLAHEAMPGHALQFAHYRRFTGSTPTRAMLWSRSFGEGWAVYTEGLMADRGYPGRGNPAAFRLAQLKVQLRTVINAILDARVHCLDIPEAEAMALMTGQGYQEEGDAALKWRRALLTSASLSIYYVGSAEIRDLAADLRREHHSWPDRQVHDALLSHGAPPVRHLRTLLAVH
jgi:Bacterial protein of unknown function (DUF885)